MLTQMSIRNFALIEQMNISFNDGITIFTGETGAGKSILMDAFSILLENAQVASLFVTVKIVLLLMEYLILLITKVFKTY